MKTNRHSRSELAKLIPVFKTLYTLSLMKQNRTLSYPYRLLRITNGNL